MTCSDRSSLIALVQNKPPVAEQTSCLLAPTAAQEGFKPGHREILSCLHKGRGKKNQAPLALVLTFSHCWKASHSTLKNSWHKFLVYVEFAATSFHSNNLSYILLFYEMHASLPFLSKGIFYCRGGIMTV